MKYIQVVVFLFLLSSCTESGKVMNERYKDTNGESITFSFITTKEYILDSETSYLTAYLQYVDTDSLAKVCFVNNHNNSIYMYNAESTDFIKKLEFEKEGNNGVHTIQGFSIVNDDSIFVYSYNTQILYLTNDKSEVMSKFMMYDSEESSYDHMISAPYLATNSPLKVHLGHVYSTGLGSGETSFETTENRPVVTSLNIQDGERTYLVNYPKQYADYNWAGGFGYRMPYFDLDSSSLVVSFAADHNLTRLDLRDKSVTPHYAGSTKINYIASYPQNKSLPINEDKAYDWYMTNASYEGVFYDRYRKLYYRIARLPIKDYAPGGTGNRKPVVIIALDANLNYLGETTLPTDIRYHTTNCYVSKEGFNIQVLTDDEDKLTFHQYVLAE